MPCGNVAQREAVLQEAREDLDRARQIGGPGHYTGQTVGPFRLGVVIGRGGMGEVYEGVDLRTHDVVAVKLMRDEEVLGDAAHVARFLRWKCAPLAPSSCRTSFV